MDGQPSSAATGLDTVACMLCGRPWLLSRAVDVERQRYWVCGPPRHCHQYARTVAAQSIIAPRRPPLWERDRTLYRAVCLAGPR